MEKENCPNNENIENLHRIGHLEAEKHRSSNRLCKRKRYIKILIFTCFIAAIVLLAIVFTNTNRSNPLEGTWYMDAVTVYKFYGDGKGAMVLPSVEYTFSYSVEDNTLNIDFDHEGAKDAQYTFFITGDALTLDGGNSTTQGRYVLNMGE